MANTRRRRSSLKYESLLQSLREQITSGQYAPSDALLSESQLCQQFGVSRGPVRQALDVLARERLIYRIPGKGSFVADNTTTRQQGSTKRLHVLVDASAGLDDNFVVLEMIDGFTQALTRLGGSKLHYEFHRFRGTDDLRAEELIEGKDGLLVIPFTEHCVHFVESIQAVEIPVVTLFDKISSNSISNFFVNHEEAAYRATSLLFRLGHKRVCHVTDALQPGSFASNERRRGYTRAVKEAGADPDMWSIEGGDVNPAKVRDVIYSRLSQSDRPTGMLIGGGLMTPGALQAVDQLGLNIPDELSIIAFDDTAEAAMYDPPLCVIKQPLHKLAERALEQLITEIDQPGSQCVQVGLIPDLILRDSYAPRDV